MRTRIGSAALGALALVLSSCTDKGPLSPLTPDGTRPALAEAASVTDVNISQIYGGGGNTGATYTNDFVELYNAGTSTVTLTGWSVQYASATGTGNFVATALSGSLEPGQYYLVRLAAGTTPSGALPAADATGTLNLGGGAGKVALVSQTANLACNGGSTPCSAEQTARIVDLVGYGTANFFEGAVAAGPTNNTSALLRKADGCTDTNNNGADFVVGPVAPRNTASARVPCAPVAPVAPTVASTAPASAATGVALNANVDVTFSKPVTVTGSWFAITCTTSGAHPAVASGGPATFSLDPDADFAPGETCTVAVTAAQVADQSTPPLNMAADYSWSFTTIGEGDVCTQPFTRAFAIQGSGPASLLAGQTVTTQGVVVADYEGPSPALRGFFLQDAAGDGDASTSDAVFVFNGTNANAVKLGDVVRVTGAVSEFAQQTQVSAAGAVTSCGTGAVALVDVSLPLASADYLERFEGMLVRLPQKLYVTEHFELGRFGEVVLSSGARLPQPTSVAAPGAAALAVQAANDLNRIVLDDTLNAQNADPIIFGRGGRPLSAANTLRGGDAATGIVGVLSGAVAGGTAYRVRPVNTLGGGLPAFEAANPRPMTPPQVGGTLKVVALNVLNYFNTFTGCTGGVGGRGMDCRGADNATEFARQWPKTIAAIVAMDADVVGINEVENDGYDSQSAIADIVAKLNTATAPGTYAFINADAATGQTNALGTDAIRVGLIYKPARVKPVGTTAALNTVAFVNGGDPAPRGRPALAQAFEQGNRGRFVVTVNHFKSKGSACSVPDAKDGQGNCNAVRTTAARELLRWLATDPTGTGDPDVLIMGDLNSYAKEDPITALTEEGGFTNLIASKLGANAYSYAFDGQWGYLDHALASASLAPLVTSVADWHINADEPGVLDYNTEFKTSGQLGSLYSADPFRVADHDPVIVGLDLPAPPNRAPTAAAGGPYASVEGAGVAFTGTASSDPEGETLTYAWSFGDGATATGATPSHSYAQDGSYTVQLVVTDPHGLSSTATVTASVTNVAPSVSAPAKTGGLLPGETYGAVGSFADPGADPWSATVDYGDGTGTASLPLAGKSFSLSHGYALAGTFTVTVTVNDDDAAGTGATTVTVITIAAAIDNALGLVDGLARDRKINAGIATALRAKLQAAKASVARGDTAAALTELRSVLKEIDSLIADRRLKSADAAPLQAYVSRIITSLSR